MARQAFTTLSTVSVVDALVASLRDRVLDGQIQAGTTLAENEVAAEYGVSRPTAKSAISTLVHQGLLQREANKPATVPRLGIGDIDDLFLVRIPLELEVVRGLAGVDGGVLEEAERAVADLDRLRPSTSHSTFVEADLRFHQILVDAIGSPRLSRLYRTIQGEIHLCMVQTRLTLGRDRIAAEHRAVLDALRDGGAEAAVRCMREHLDGAHSSLRRHFSAAG
ncbi:GntR family transcriptional regulator [Saccharopolyspora erythraea]|uniref:GntR family transcriptional regulator n=1 Tax=Saccharopolyspora erythraea TaxID=1836 RepID=UPI001BA65D5E|nr:GntR family transcriptional regulator [Saccharopolyspora erythraea]QUH02386.1 GntR family transcriptional regulator [Saccharopolyspora erythraea]